MVVRDIALEKVGVGDLWKLLLKLFELPCIINICIIQHLLKNLFLYFFLFC